MNIKFTCSKGRIATKCCIYKLCKKSPFMCGVQLCDCENSHQTCFCDCRLSLILAGLDKQNSPDSKALNQMIDWYDKIVLYIKQQKKVLYDKILENRNKPLEPTLKKIFQMIKENRKQQITSGMLGEVADEVRKATDPSFSEIASKIKTGKETLLAEQKKIKFQLKKIRMLWDINMCKQSRFRQRLIECGIIGLKIDGKKTKQKNFQLQEITEIHLQKVDNQQIIQGIAESCLNLSVLRVDSELKVQVLDSFVKSLYKFKKLMQIHISNNVNQLWKQCMCKSKPGLQVIRVQKQPTLQVEHRQAISSQQIQEPSLPQEQINNGLIRAKIQHDQM